MMAHPLAAAPPRDAALAHVQMIVGTLGMEALSSARYAVLNPATGAVVGTAPLGDVRDADDAVRCATAALAGWQRTPVEQRAALLCAGIEAVAADAPALAALLTCEQGKPLAEAREEIHDFCCRLRVLARLACATPDGRVPLLPSMRSSASADAGVTIALVCWNFPVGLLAKKIGPVLLAGGTVIVKPAMTTPLATVRVLELMNTAGLPPGVLNCVTGDGARVGARLIAHPAVSRVHLTGSDDTGRAIHERATRSELLLELAGSDPMIVCRDADLEKAVQAVIVGRYRNAGQVCTAVKRLYVATEVYPVFVDELVRRVRLFELGDGLTPAAAPLIRMGPLHTAAGRLRLEEQLHDAVAAGAQPLVGGGRPRQPELAAGHFFAPTIVAGAGVDSRLATEEVFGPVLPVFRTASVHDAIDAANRSRWHLNASIWTRDRDVAAFAKPRLRGARVWINRLATQSHTVNAPES